MRPALSRAIYRACGLIALGTGAAWLYSVVATVLPDIFPSTFRSADGMVGVYYEAAAVITVLVLLGQVLELRGHQSKDMRVDLVSVELAAVVPAMPPPTTTTSPPSTPATCTPCSAATR